MDRFPVLRGITVVLKVLAVLVFVVGLIIGFGGLGAGNQLGGIATFGTMLVAAIYAIGLWVAAELIGVLLAIEENTRQGAMLRATPPPDAPSSGAGRPAGTR